MSRGKIEKTNEYYMNLFSQHVQIDTDSGCHLWTASKNNVGYGLFRYKNGMMSSHRVIMDLLGYDIKGKIVYHTCGNYHCVNPNHLRVGTKEDKIQQMRDNGKTGVIWKDTKYHKTCPHCGYHGSPAVIGNFHNDRCKQKTNQS